MPKADAPAKKPKAAAAPAKKATKATDAKKTTTKADSAPSKRMKKDAPAKKVSSARANAKKVCTFDACCALCQTDPTSSQPAAKKAVATKVAADKPKSAASAKPRSRAKKVGDHCFSVSVYV